MSKWSSVARDWFDEAIAVVQDVEDAVNEALRFLPQRQQRLLRRRFGIGEQAVEVEVVADELELSLKRLRALERRTLRRLREQAARILDDPSLRRIAFREVS